ncbi:hypothetical protein BLOT_016865 [Blomia tropicalis]|nr:hypothetical protein BLOT_016865 [Blomia tropicalis]
MIIIDEGQLLKNGQSALNRSISRIKTLRRIILTGTPLQNNLSEYLLWLVLLFPFLGTLKDLGIDLKIQFQTVNPLDSPMQMCINEEKSTILHKLLKDCIHRCDYNILVPYLEKKYEYVLTLRLTSTQAKCTILKKEPVEMVDDSLDNFIVYSDCESGSSNSNRSKTSLKWT